MFSKQTIVTLDLEGVLIPEIWIAFAAKTGISELKLTTRDIPDYDELMQGRLAILRKHNLGIQEIQEVISTLTPLEGALDFLNTLRQETQVIILSDTFQEFAWPMMQQLGFPTLFCHRLLLDGNTISGYKLRQVDQKRKSVAALQSLEYKVLAGGDSYNDTTMLSQADHGILFKAPQNVIDEFPQFAHTRDYNIFLNMIRDWIKSL
jgi:phosphoserine / homoserine phosphotransferase